MEQKVFGRIWTLPLSYLYAGIVKSREIAYRRGILQTKRLDTPVTAVGNITAGGAGKTPLAMWIAEFYARSGKHPVIISRGYKGIRDSDPMIVTDGEKIRATPREAGDEPYQMARLLKSIPVIVGADRYEAGLLAEKTFHPGVIILDDAYQHIQLHRQLNILVIDGEKSGLDAGILPAGPLREPLSGIKRAGAIVVTHNDRIENRTALTENLKKYNENAPLFFCRHRPDRLMNLKTCLPEKLAVLQGMRTAAFAGIGRPESFKKTMEQVGANILYFKAFPDHYRYDRKDVERLLEESKNAGADRVITTAKDAVRLLDFKELTDDISMLTVKLEFTDKKDQFVRLIEKTVESADGE